MSIALRALSVPNARALGEGGVILIVSVGGLGLFPAAT